MCIVRKDLELKAPSRRQAERHPLRERRFHDRHLSGRVSDIHSGAVVAALCDAFADHTGFSIHCTVYGHAEASNHSVAIRKIVLVGQSLQYTLHVTKTLNIPETNEKYT